MRKNLTEIVFILDRSGSMSGLEQDTIGGFNSMIKQQKNAEGEALISTILFDNVSEVLHDRINVKDASLIFSLYLSSGLVLHTSKTSVHCSTVW